MDNLSIRSASIVRQLIEIADEAQKIIEAQRQRIIELEAESQLEDPIPYVMSVNNVAEILQVSRPFVYEMCEQGKIPASREGKRWFIMRDDFRNYLKSKQKFLKNKLESA